jgi:hypothetical protein
LFFKNSNIMEFIEYKPHKFLVGMSSMDIYHFDAKTQGITPIKKN